MSLTAVRRTSPSGRMVLVVHALPIHQPPPAPLVAELVRAGVSWSTAMAMESWKAREVLELLRDRALAETRGGLTLPLRGTI